MTLAEKWLNQFYPETAEALFVRVGQDKLALLQHSLWKFRGLRPKVLGKYGLKKNEPMSDGHIQDDSGFALDITTAISCALCWAFDKGDCFDCPLSELRGGHSCTGFWDREDISPYSSFIRNSDPEPMIKLLERAILREKRVKPS